MSYSDRPPTRYRRPMSTAVAIVWVSSMLIIAFLLSAYIMVKLFG